MKTMAMKSLRGASPSKVVQLFPDVLQEALALSRWTTKKTFLVSLSSSSGVGVRERPTSKLTQIQRPASPSMGIQSAPPANVTAEEHVHERTKLLGRQKHFATGEDLLV